MQHINNMPFFELCEIPIDQGKCVQMFLKIENHVNDHFKQTQAHPIFKNLQFYESKLALKNPGPTPNCFTLQTTHVQVNRKRTQKCNKEKLSSELPYIGIFCRICSKKVLDLGNTTDGRIYWKKYRTNGILHLIC